MFEEDAEKRGGEQFLPDKKKIACKCYLPQDGGFGSCGNTLSPRC